MGKYIIFDMDGTLLDTELLIIRCWETAAEKYGIPGIVPVCRECIGTTYTKTQEILKSRYGQAFPILDILNEVMSDFNGRIESEGPPQKPFAKELLQYLKSVGFQTAVASSTSSGMVKKELEKVGLLKYFDCIVGGEETVQGKLAPDIFLAACKKLGCSPEDAMVVEDSFYGIQAANLAGTIPLMVPDLIAPTPEIVSLCRGVFRDLSEVKKYIEIHFE